MFVSVTETPLKVCFTPNEWPIAKFFFKVAALLLHSFLFGRKLIDPAQIILIGLIMSLVEPYSTLLYP